MPVCKSSAEAVRALRRRFNNRLFFFDFAPNALVKIWLACALAKRKPAGDTRERIPAGFKVKNRSYMLFALTTRTLLLSQLVVATGSSKNSVAGSANCSTSGVKTSAIASVASST